MFIIPFVKNIESIEKYFSYKEVIILLFTTRYKKAVTMKNETISITPETKVALQKLKSKQETYDSIIKKLINEYVSKELDNKWNQILAAEEFIPLEEL